MGDPKIRKNGEGMSDSQSWENWRSWKIGEEHGDGGPQAGKLMKKVETGGMKVGELVKKIQMNEPQVGKVWRSGSFGQEECMKPEQGAMLAEAGEEDEFIKCFDDITGKELPWQAVKEAREKEVKYLRELGVYEKVDERAAVAKHNVTPVDTKWVDTDKAFEGEPMQIRSRIVARDFKSGNRPDLYAGTPPLEALKAFISIAASHSPEFSLMHIDVSRGYFHAKAQRPVLVKLPSEDCSGKDEGKIGLLKKSMYGTRDAASNWERALARASRKLGVTSLGAVQQTCSTTRKGKPRV